MTLQALPQDVLDLISPKSWRATPSPHWTASMGLGPKPSTWRANPYGSRKPQVLWNSTQQADTSCCIMLYAIYVPSMHFQHRWVPLKIATVTGRSSFRNAAAKTARPAPEKSSQHRITSEVQPVEAKSSANLRQQTCEAQRDQRQWLGRLVLDLAWQKFRKKPGELLNLLDILYCQVRGEKQKLRLEPFRNRIYT